MNAEDAERLMNDEAFQDGFNSLRTDTLEALAIAGPEEITRLQIRISVIDDFRSHLEDLIIEATSAKREKAAPA